MKKKTRKRPAPIDHELLAKIERYMGEKKLSPSAFGVKALNDPRLVKDLREGRALRWYARQAVEKMMSGEA